MNLLTGTILVLIFSGSSIAASYTTIPLWHAETRLGNGDPLLNVDSDDSYYEKRQQQKQFEKQRQKKEDIRRRDKIDAIKKEQRLKRLRDEEKKKAGPR